MLPAIRNDLFLPHGRTFLLFDGRSQMLDIVESRCHTTNNYRMCYVVCESNAVLFQARIKLFFFAERVTLTEKPCEYWI